jgi:hypothetical protein
VQNVVVLRMSAFGKTLAITIGVETARKDICCCLNIHQWLNFKPRIKAKLLRKAGSHSNTLSVILVVDCISSGNKVIRYIYPTHLLDTFILRRNFNGYVTSAHTDTDVKAKKTL